MFHWWFHKKELTMTFDRTYYDTVCGKLAAGGIDYRTKWRDMNSVGRSRGTMGSFGQERTTQYYIYVRKQDYDKAAAMLH